MTILDFEPRLISDRADASEGSRFSALDCSIAAEQRRGQRVVSSDASRRPLEGACQRQDELVERARRGDVDAYETLLREHEGFAYRVAYVVTRDAGDAEDALQEAFLKAFRALHRFRRGAEFRPWLLKIVTNEARTKRRSRQRHSAVASRAVAREPRPAPQSPPDASVLADEERNRLLRAIDALPDKLRAVVTCRYLLELSEHETAATLGIRPGTVKSRLSRALDGLERLLGPGE